MIVSQLKEGSAVRAASGMPFLSRVNIYPIKSLDGISVDVATVLPSGSLQHDREYAIFDELGELVNGKRTSRVHQLRTSFDLDLSTVYLQGARDENRKAFRLEEECEELAKWLSDYFGFSVTMRRIPLGLPDHNLTPGPSVVSTASLKTASSWFEHISAEQVRLRFRANLEISGVPTFWEDGLIDGFHAVKEFQIGDVRFEGARPCERCVVPSRDPSTGTRHRGFQRVLATRRKETLPPWSPLGSFRHFYHFCVLTRVPASEAGKILKVGDEVKAND